jgi:transposase
MRADEGGSEVKYWVGFDVAKAFHWATVVDDEGNEVFSRRVEATEEDLAALCSELARLGGERRVGIDLVGGPAALLEAVLFEQGERIFHVPGVAVNRARDAYGGEAKSDPRDARIIADQLRLRWRSLPEVRLRGEAAAEVRALVGHRRDLVQEQTRRIARLRGLLSEVFPGLEAALNLTRKGALLVVTKAARPTTVRGLGQARLARWLKSRGVRKAHELAGRVLGAAQAQRLELPAAEVKATLAAEIATEILRAKERLAALDARLEALVAQDPQGAIVMSLPGMGVVLTAEFLAEAGDVCCFGSADQLAAAAGIAPVLRSSGAISYRRRARRGNKDLKDIFYRSALYALPHHETSKSFYRRKRDEGKGHHQAVLALARRRVNVLWAMLRDGRAYEEQTAKAA